MPNSPAREDGSGAAAQIAKAAALYFALVFATGFVLGTIRVLWTVPRFGERTAELLEEPLMLVAVILAARWTVRRLAVPPARSRRLAVGLIALALLLVAELAIALLLRGLSLGEYVKGRDPVAGAVYLIMLVVFAAMPALVSGSSRR